MAESLQKLSEEQIFESLRELNVPVRMSDIKTPTRDFIIRVLECFLKDLMVDITSPHARTWEATRHIEEAELYEDVQPLILLLLSVNYIIGITGLKLDIKDIVEPKPKRTKKVLNYIIVFWLYYLKKYSRFADIEKAFEPDKQNINELIDEIKAKDEKYIELNNILEERKKNEQFSNLKEKKQKIFNLENLKDEVAANYQALKTEESHYQKEICSVEVSITTAKEKLKELAQLILSSPDRLNADLQKLKDKVKIMELKAKEKEAEIKEKKIQLHDTEGCLEKDRRILNSLEKVMEDVQNFCDIVKSVILEKEKLETEETQAKTLEIELADQEVIKGHQDRKKTKHVLNLKIAKDSLFEAVKKQENAVFKKKETIELCTNTGKDLELQIDGEARSILELRKKYEEYDSEYNKMLSWFQTSLDDTVQTFKDDCEEITAMLNIN